MLRLMQKINLNSDALHLFKALPLFFLANFPCPTFIPCPTSTPDSRVKGMAEGGRPENLKGRVKMWWA